MSRRVTLVVPRAQIPSEGLCAIEVEGRRLVLCTVDGRLHALRDHCTHQGFPLSNVGCLVEGRLMCGLHGSTFDPATGESHRPPATKAVTVYETEIDGNEIRIHLDGLDEP